ncbi:ABC transporter ATP-binding protein [Geopsychrobacter electrodiphilus]|uniref:ABC transporter ATP-binding protein n=1 Tax=Geopsychrobacter electrodiphilus TaxID=225196 RepID=UPI00038195C7|nr:ABC transporter ATP-binding protein [Geopsychrobacter electrodiphilus]
MPFVHLKKLEKRFESNVDCVIALNKLELAVEEGCFLGIMGPSGSGKSTLLSILGGLCHPTSGKVLVDDIDVYGLGSEQRADFRREYLGFVFQSFNLIPYLTALENVMLPLAVKKLSTPEKNRMANEVLIRVGLGHRIGHLPSQLSGGEQERVAIARALVNAPPLILADEPTGSLDSATSEEIMSLFLQLNAEGQTIIMVTHNDENRAYFDRTVVLRDGRIESDSARTPKVVSQVC